MLKLALTTLFGTVTNLTARVAVGADGPFTVLDLVIGNDSTINGRVVPTFVPVTLTGLGADFVKDRLYPGKHVMVTGALKQDKWTDDGGGKHARLKVRAQRLECLPDDLFVTKPDKAGVSRLGNGVNDTLIAGNVVADPTYQVLPGKDAIKLCTFSVALNSPEMKNGEFTGKSDPDYVDVKVWNDAADDAFATIKKGSPVTVSGGLVLESWTGPEGQPRSKIVLESTFCAALSPDGERAPAQTEDNLPPAETALAQEQDAEQAPF